MCIWLYTDVEGACNYPSFCPWLQPVMKISYTCDFFVQIIRIELNLAYSCLSTYIFFGKSAFLFNKPFSCSAIGVTYKGLIQLFFLSEQKENIFMVNGLPK